MQAMLLAAGFGTRLRPYSLIRPKPLFPVLNRPLLHILLDMLHRAGCRRIVVNCHHLADQVRQAVCDIPAVTLQYEQEILGTGGSLRQAVDRLADEPLLVMNGDIFHTIDLQAIYRFHRQHANPVTMVLHNCPRFNTVLVRNGRVMGFDPAGHRPGESLLAFTGIHIVDPEVIDMIPAGRFHHIIDLYRQLVVQGHAIGVFRADGSFWRDMGTTADYLRLHEELLTGAVTAASLPRVAGSWCTGREVEIAGGVRLADWGCLGNEVQVARDVHLARCVVWDGTRIAAGRRHADQILVPGLSSGAER